MNTETNTEYVPDESTIETTETETTTQEMLLELTTQANEESQASTNEETTIATETSTLGKSDCDNNSNFLNVLFKNMRCNS